MRRYLTGALSFAVMAFILVSCSNFEMPEKIHVKAKVAPTIGIKEETGDIGGKFSELMDEAFDQSDGKSMKVYDLRPADPEEGVEAEEDDGVKKFLIHLPSIFDQNFNLKEYFEADLGFEKTEIKYEYSVVVPSGAQPIPGQKFPLELPDTEEEIPMPLGDMSDTITEVQLTKVGIRVVFATINDDANVEICVSSDAFGLPRDVWKKPGADGSVEFVNTNGLTFYPGDEIKYPNNELSFTVQYRGTIDLDGADLVAGKKVPIVEGTPEMIFDWTTAKVDLANSNADSRIGTYDVALGDIKKDLKDFEFKNIFGYLYISSPPGSTDFTPKMTITSNYGDNLLGPDQILTIHPTPLALPAPDEGGKLIYKGSAYKDDVPLEEKIDLTDAFNHDGDKLTLEYELGFSTRYITITNNEENTNQRLQADLFIELPLELGIKSGAEIDLGELMDFGDEDLLSFLDSDDSDTQIELYTLGIRLDLDDTLFKGGDLVVKNIAKDNYGYLVDPDFEVTVPLTEKSINLDLGKVTSPFIPSLIIGFENADDPTLTIMRDLHLVSVQFTIGLDATIAF
jgi:hypothetical protein